uniref:Endonuclease/exonuclease/phosphatase family protein n=2 Tax=unclassified Prevotella TaxID=2638335 RepID=A0AB33JJ13_9BACT
MKKQMKLRNIISAAVLLFALPLSMMGQDQLRIMTFNIRSFEPNFDIQPYAEKLKAETPDIICLNEVENRSSRQQKNGKYRDLVAELAQKLNMFNVFGYSYNLSNKDGKLPEEQFRYSTNELYGNAILSRYPIMAVQAMQLPRPTGSADQRGVVTADILLPSGKIIRVACSHLDHVGGQLEQAEVLITDKVKSATIPTILCGDMNMGPGSAVINKLLTAYDRLDSDEGSFGHYAKIDFILGSKNHWKMSECRVLDNYQGSLELSDHCPVLSVVSLK